MKKNILFVVLISALIIPQIVMASWWNPFSWKIWKNMGDFFGQKNEQTIVCTQDAKLCPDGSYVSRKGPKCEFDACPDEIDISGWKTYTDTEAGFSIKYPESNKIEISKEKIDLMVEGPGKSCDNKKGIQDEKDLSSGKFGGCTLFPLKVSERVVKKDIQNIKTWMVLSAFEVCDVQFTNKAMFYNNGYQVTISSVGEKNEIIDTLNDYFTINKENCGDAKVWFDGGGSDAKQNKFYNDLRNNKIVGPAAVWFNTFNKIITTIEFAKTAVSDEKEKACTNSGGKVKQISCYCSSTQDFFNNCAVGACTCTPDQKYLRKLKSCECPKGECFDGMSCINQEL